MDYLFLSGVLALDLVNTEVVVRGKRYDLFATPEDVAEWWQQALTHHPDEGKIRVDAGGIAWSADIGRASACLTSPPTPSVQSAKPPAAWRL